MIRWLMFLSALALGSNCGDGDNDKVDSSGRVDTAGSDSGGGGDDSDSPSATPCDPDSADFDGDVVPQAGVETNAAGGCSAVSGFPASDELVLDDFGEAVFAGSGSGFEILSLSAGSFSNEDGFYLLEDLPTNTEILMVAQGAEGITEFTFTIEPGDPARLVSTSVLVRANRQARSAEVAPKVPWSKRAALLEARRFASCAQD